MWLTGWRQSDVPACVREIASHGTYTFYVPADDRHDRDLYVRHAHASGFEHTRVAAGTFIAWSYEPAPVLTIGHAYVFVHCAPVFRTWPVIAVSPRLSRVMQIKYKCVDPHKRYPIAWTRTRHNSEDTSVAFTLHGRLPVRPATTRHRQHPRWRIINGGHMQRCVPAIVAVNVRRPYGRVLVHFGDAAVIMHGVYRIEFSNHGEIIMNEWYVVGRDGLYRYGTDNTWVVVASRAQLRVRRRRRI